MRVTPLNIASAGLLVMAALPLVQLSSKAVSTATFYYYMVLVVLCVISDLMFRAFLRNLKRIWIVELSFIIFVAILIGILIRL
jgi:hypothetical protein